MNNKFKMIAGSLVVLLMFTAVPAFAQNPVKKVKYADKFYYNGEVDPSTKQPSGKGAIYLDGSTKGSSALCVEGVFNGQEISDMKVTINSAWGKKTGKTSNIFREPTDCYPNTMSFTGTATYSIDADKKVSIDIKPSDFKAKWTGQTDIAALNPSSTIKISGYEISSSKGAFSILFDKKTSERNDTVRARGELSGTILKPQITFSDFDKITNKDGDQLIPSADGVSVVKVIHKDGKEEILPQTNMPDFEQMSSALASKGFYYYYYITDKPENKPIACEIAKKYSPGYPDITVTLGGFSYPNDYYYYSTQDRYNGGARNDNFNKEFKDGELRVYVDRHTILIKAKHYGNAEFAPKYIDISNYWQADYTSIADLLGRNFNYLELSDGTFENGQFYEKGQSPTELKKAAEAAEYVAKKKAENNAQKTKDYNKMIAKVGKANYNKLMNNSVPKGITLDQLQAYADFVWKYYEKTEHHIATELVSNSGNCRVLDVWLRNSDGKGDVYGSVTTSLHRVTFQNGRAIMVSQLSFQ